MASDYSRPAGGFRFKGGRLKTNSSADSMPEDCYPYLQNSRFYNDSSATSRPQIIQSQAAPASPGPILSLEPTIGIYKVGSAIFNAGTQIDTGYAAGLGASLLPFRPDNSPNAYEYVFDQNKATKVFIPSSGSAVVQKAGIAEPQTAPDACPDQFRFFDTMQGAGTWTPAGTAGAVSQQTRVADTAVAFFADPASVAPSVSTRYSMQVSTGQYQAGVFLKINIAGGGGTTAQMVVQDVLPPVTTKTLQIQSIFYNSGSVGKCVIALTQLSISDTTPVDGQMPISQSVNTQQLIASIRRGSLIQLNNGGANAEIVFVLSATQGPGGQISIETSTVNTHIATELIQGIPAVSVSFKEDPATLVGQAIAAAAIQTAVTVGTGTVTETISTTQNPFINQSLLTDGALPQEDDYVHFSVNISDLTLLTSIRIIFDVTNGAADFVSNTYYKDVRPNDLTGAVAGTQSQLGGAQQAAQRSLIDSEVRRVTPNFNPSGSIEIPPIDVFEPTSVNTSDQTSLGVSQWSEIMFPISSMTRVGNDQTRTLANTQAIRFQLVVTGTVTFQFGALFVTSGGQPDTGDSGFAYFYRVRPRNSVTGVRGNPSPASRYGIKCRRQRGIVSLPSAAYDSQIDTWDIFRIGGTLTDWRYVGSTQSSNAAYADNQFDLAITNNEALSFDNLEPFPSIGPPITASSATVVGTTMTATFSNPGNQPSAFGTLSQLGAMLPGNIILVGQQAFTLFNRPTLVSSTGTTQTYLFKFVECAGTQTNPLVLCQEPNLAAQPTNRVFGPDAQGVFFSVQAGMVNNQNLGLRAGLIQWTNPNNPDGASSANTKDLCPPTEPLQNGIIVDGSPYVFSSERAWRGYPQTNGSYAWQQLPVSRGLVAEFGICTDGATVYIVCKDGIRAGNSATESLTDADLYNLFPHEGVFPQNVTFAGQTVFAPEYRYMSNVRLACVNGYLYFDYLDSTQIQRTLVCDLKKNAWSVDVYSPNPATIHAGVTSPSSNQKVPASAIRNNPLFIGDTTGAIYVEQSSPSSGSGESVSCVVVTREEMVGDIRANKIFGDAMLDCLPLSVLTVTPVFLGTVFGTSTVIASSISRPTSPPVINLSGEQLKRSLGLVISWTDQGLNSSLYSWQISYITQPEDITNRMTDWDNAGNDANKFWQGFQIECDTNNNPKTLIVRDADTLLSHAFTSDNSALAQNQIRANGQQVITCSFPVPFRAHLARIEPDNTVWRLYKLMWIVESTPEAAMNWITQPTSHGLPGYQHVKQFMFPYSATAQVVITVTVDGTAFTPATLPATSGYQKTLVVMPPNKGLVFQYSAVSTQPFSVWTEDLEVFVKSWGDAGGYRNIKLIGGSMSPRASI